MCSPVIWLHFTEEHNKCGKKKIPIPNRSLTLVCKIRSRQYLVLFLLCWNYLKQECSMKWTIKSAMDPHVSFWDLLYSKEHLEETHLLILLPFRILSFFTFSTKVLFCDSYEFLGSLVSAFTLKIDKMRCFKFFVHKHSRVQTVFMIWLSHTSDIINMKYILLV